MEEFNGGGRIKPLLKIFGPHCVSEGLESLCGLCERKALHTDIPTMSAQLIQDGPTACAPLPYPSGCDGVDGLGAMGSVEYYQENEREVT